MSDQPASPSRSLIWRAVQFCKWANQIVKGYTIQGWVMDVDRLKSGGSVLTEDFFGRQWEKVREIRLSERKFYQKITDIYATALDDYTTVTAMTHFLQRCKTSCPTLFSAKRPPR